MPVTDIGYAQAGLTGLNIIVTCVRFCSRPPRLRPGSGSPCGSETLTRVLTVKVVRAIARHSRTVDPAGTETT